jgi:hypothetical protein
LISYANVILLLVSICTLITPGYGRMRTSVDGITHEFVIHFSMRCGPVSVVGIATGYGLDGLRIESRWGARFSAPVQTDPGDHPASCTMGTGGKERSGRDSDPSPPSSTVVMKELSYGPYGLCRASVPVQGCTLPFTSLR